MEEKVKQLYYVRDWKDEKVKLTVPVKTCRTITRKVWTKVPVPDCGCDNPCAPPAEEPVVELAPTPVKPDEEQVLPDTSN
jgi:hypothetical protein